jgi:hypothetical protein
VNEFGVILSLIGVWGWIGSMLLFIFKGFPSRSEFKAKQASIWGGSSLLFFCCWIVGMLVA